MDDKVKAALDSGKCPPEMTEDDCDAFDPYGTGDRCANCWRKAFEAEKKPKGGER